MEKYRICIFRRPGPASIGLVVVSISLALIVGAKGEQSVSELPASSPSAPSPSPSSLSGSSGVNMTSSLAHAALPTPAHTGPKLMHSVVRGKHHTGHHVHAHYPGHHFRGHHYHTNQRIQWAPRTATGQLAANATRAVTNMVSNVNHAIHSFFHSRPKPRSSAAGSPFFKLLTGESIISNTASKLFPSASKLLQARKSSDNESRSRFISGVVASPSSTAAKPSLSLLSLGSSSSSTSSSPASSPSPAPSSSSSSSSSSSFLSSSSSPFSFSSLFDSHRTALQGSESVVHEVTVNATEHLNSTYSPGSNSVSSGNNRTNEAVSATAAINPDNGDRLRDEIVGRVSNLQTALTHAIEFSKDRREYISNKLLEQTNLRLEQAKERTHRFLSDPRNQEMTAKAIHSVNTGIEKTNNWFQGIMARVGQTILDRAAQRVQQQKLKLEMEKQMEEIRLEKLRYAGNSTTVESTTAKSIDK